MAINKVFLASPQGDEIKEVEATTEALSPLMSRGWRQVPAPTATTQPGIIRDSEERGVSTAAVPSTCRISSPWGDCI